ncbi:laccase-15-like [Panicum hallii]|nr:laccase-15-like [Panicum hallii]
MTRSCKETLVTVVNGQLPGPAIEVTEGDSLSVHVVNKSPYNITIHWHGVKQRLSCWADGVPMITQCPIRPNHNFTYRFDVAGQEGTLWWHAHVGCFRATLHGALIIRPRHGASSYPFPKPHVEIPMIIGEWWDMDLVQLERNMVDGDFRDNPTAMTINGQLGDPFNCSGIVKDGFVLDVEAGMTYLLRLINAALFTEFYLKIAGHKFTVVASDANYVNPYTRDTIAIAPGETMDVLVVADAPPGKYFMVAVALQTPKPDQQIPFFMTSGMVQYRSGHSHNNGTTGHHNVAPVVPELPDQHDTITTYYFHGNLTSLRHPRRPQVPVHADEYFFITLSDGSICRHGRQSCKRSGSNESILVAAMNNVSFQLPASVAAPLLEAHYYHRNNTASIGGVDLYMLPNSPPRVFNFTDLSLVPSGPKEAQLEATKKRMVGRRFRHGTAVEVVFQNTALMHTDSHPMHLHGHDVFVLAQDHGIYDPAKDVAKYNLVDPPVKNTVVVPRLGWVALRFVADNPGVWYVHCHFDFHMTMGMAAVFIVDDGPTVASILPPPPDDLPNCNHGDSHASNELLYPHEGKGSVLQS